MSTILKPILAFIISALLFAGAAFLAETEMMDYVLTHFYNPSILNSLVSKNSKDAEIIQEHISALQSKFSDTLQEPSIRSSFNFNQNSEDIFERSRIFGILQETVSGLQSVQFVDSNGIRIHFSTSNRDILRQSGDSVTFRNYTEDNRALPFDIVSVEAYAPSKFTMDDSHDRIIFSFPFYDSMDVYRGTALFNLSVRSLAEKLIAENRLNPTDDISVIRIPPGVVFGSPETSASVILDKIASFWSEGLKQLITFTAEDSGEQFALISTKTDKNLFLGRIINNSIFSISTQMKRVFEISIFLTFFLTVYFFINLKPNSVSVVRSRIKKLRANLFEQLYVKKTPKERTKWVLELEQRREGIRAELKHKLKIKPKQENKINSLIDTALDELLSVIKSGAAEYPASVSAKKENKKNIEEKAPLGEEVELEEVAPLEEIEEAEPIDEVDELGELGEAEPLSEVEELEEVAPLDEIDELEELGEAEPLGEEGELEEVAPLEEIDEAEPIDEVDELGEVAPLEEIDEAEPINETAPSEEAVELKESGELIESNDETISEHTLSSQTVAVESPAEKGLLSAASKLADSQKIEKEAEPSASHSKGLLEIASKFAETKDEELPADNDNNKPAKEPASRKNIIEAAREIEFSDKYSSKPEEEQDLNVEMEIVSPFSNMFSSLDDEEQP